MKQQTMNEPALGLLDASTKIKALAQDTSVRQPHKARSSKEPTNPIYLLAMITLGIPVLLTIPLVGMNPGVQEGTLAVLTKFLVFSALFVAAIFEIKRLADQPSDNDHH
jgi:4-amino-4-deoxy-L-arabinose transferase-like glycosyltransferase